MQFSIISIITLLATVASAAPVVEDVQVMRTVDARDTSVSAGSKLVARQGSNDLSALDIFASGSCNNYQTTVFVSIPGGGPGSSNGKCFTLGSNASVRTTFLRGSCTSTVRLPRVWAPASLATGSPSRLTTALKRFDTRPREKRGEQQKSGFSGVSVKKAIYRLARRSLQGGGQIPPIVRKRGVVTAQFGGYMTTSHPEH
ncbi:hypothetical protein OOU_Y34scaffold00567g56 [Pyricularia oryzae Y34]|uniref:Uncharacterized protein n=2 Tax=Pyricularia oryzae TaxID=318829 RepID=A0AA97PKI1_PYRO3|nr:hypothetical protein OOU_Y34scaffold00567g56 [Pyricularia oryzae Y34]KAI6529484.1 hypothetical protein MCOR10_003676 [Pyricularia oryzae]